MQAPDLDTLIDPTNNLQRRVLRALIDHVRRCGELAAETGQAVEGEFRVADNDPNEPLLQIRFICEPGQEARVISVDSLEEGATGIRSSALH